MAKEIIDEVFGEKKRSSNNGLVKFWREAFEKRLGDEGLKALKELNSKYREMDLYQIHEIFPKIKIGSLKGVLDDLNWICLEITKPEGPVYSAFKGKMEELERDLERLKEDGYFSGAEPEEWKKLVEVLGVEKTRKIFAKG